MDSLLQSMTFQLKHFAIPIILYAVNINNTNVKDENKNLAGIGTVVFKIKWIKVTPATLPLMMEMMGNPVNDG